MTWLEPEKWKNMQSGKDCPLCHDMQGEKNDFSYKIAEFESSIWRLPKRQQPKGYTLLVAKVHATELFLMEPTERQRFFDETAKAAAIVSRVYQPVKLHYGIFGSICPHVHLHIIPKYLTDDPHGPVLFGKGDIEIGEAEAQATIARLQDRLAQYKQG